MQEGPATALGHEGTHPVDVRSNDAVGRLGRKRVEPVAVSDGLSLSVNFLRNRGQEAEWVSSERIAYGSGTTPGAEQTLGRRPTVERPERTRWKTDMLVFLVVSMVGVW